MRKVLVLRLKFDQSGRAASQEPLKKGAGWGLSPKIPQTGYDDTQHMHIGRGRRIGRARFYG